MSVKIPKETKEVFTEAEMKRLWEKYSDERQKFEYRYNLFSGMTTNFKEQLGLAMKVNGVTFEELAEKIGVSAKTVRRYNDGHNAPSMQMLVAICIALHLDTKQSTSLLATLGRCFQGTRKEDYAYMYLIEQHSGKSIDECNKILVDLNIDKKHRLYPRKEPAGEK